MATGTHAPSGRAVCALGLAAVLLSAATSVATVDVSGTWNLCLESVTSPQRPVATLAQQGGHVSGSVAYPFFGGGTLTCVVGFDIDPATGAFVPGTATEQCQLGASFLLRPAVATQGRMDGEYRQEFDRTPFYGLRACDPMAPGACDDGDPSTLDTCSASVDCSGAPLAPSCVHTGCTTDADCPDAFQCTFDRCDPGQGCAHPVVLSQGDPRPFCEDGDVCTVREQCNLAVCGSGPLTATVTSMNAPTVSLGRLGATAGDDTLTLKGRVTLPAPLTIDPIENGVRLRMLDAAGTTAVDEQIPGGVFDPLTGVGWSTSGKGVRYADKRKVDPGAIRKVSIRSNLAIPGFVRFDVSGRAGTYAASPALPIGVFLDLGGDPNGSPVAGGACASFSAASCATASGGTKIRCS